MFLKNPSEEDLERLGINRSTYQENFFHDAKLGCLCYWNTLYSCYYFFVQYTAITSAIGFGIGAALEEEWEAFFDFLHFVPLMMNVAGVATNFHFYQDLYLDVFRSTNRGLFDYEGTVDDETKKDVAELKTQMKKRKKIFSSFYSNLIIMVTFFQITKKPFTYLVTGKRFKPVGENNLIWDAPFGLYIPYADHWAAYLFIEILCHNSCVLCTFTTSAMAITYQSICEELISEFEVIDLTLNRCVPRAERLCQIKTDDTNLSEKVTLDDCLHACLRLSVKHHQQTLKLYSTVKDLLFFPMFFTVFDSGLILCISVYIMISDEVSTNLKLAMPPIMVAEIGIAFLFCYYGELLSQKSASVGDSFYFGLHWIDHLAVVKPYAVLVKGYCDIPRHLSAAGFSPVNLVAFANILQAAYSYIGLLVSTP